MKTTSNTKIRTLNYLEAFDYALLELAGEKLVNVQKDTLEYTKIAIMASHYQCGPIARLAEKWFQIKGIPGAKFHSLEGHYVLLDEETGLLFDLEAVGGRVNRVDIPIFGRMMELQTMSLKDGIEEIFNRNADELLKQRKIAFSAQ